MAQLTPRLTNFGNDMMLKALKGDGITFTRIVIGDGVDPTNESSMTALKSQRVTLGIVDYEIQANYVLITGRFNNSGVTSGFHMTELGVYGYNQSDKVEHLYAYRYASTDDVDYIPAISSGRVFESEVGVIVSIGTSENINAILAEGTGYATAADLNTHINDKNNPHGVTKQQVGLGSVPNVSTNDQTPTFEPGNEFLIPESGNKLSVIMSKIAGSLTKIKEHMLSSNPHNITCDKIKASPTTHTHTASAVGAAESNHSHALDGSTITGVLPVVKGGTGVTTLESLAEALRPLLKRKVSGSYSGNDSYTRYIELGFVPSKVTVTCVNYPNNGHYSGTATISANATYPGAEGYKDANVYNGNNIGSYYHYVTVSIFRTGFYVTQCGGGHSCTNQSGQTYKYEAEEL